MPVKTIDYPHEVQHIQVLDQDGNVDKELEPKIPKKDLRRLYRAMLLTREHDENRERLQRSGEIGTFAPAFGQEAAQLGSAYALRETDWVVPSFREIAVAIWRGMPLENDLLYAAGYEEGMKMEPDGRDLPVAIPIGTQIAHAVGVAWARKLQEKDEVAITYIGDGGTSEGDWHEAMNFAAVYQTPLVVFCQNNQWAISVPLHKQTKSKTIAQKGWAYNVPSVQCDGNDILAVYRVTKEAVDRARAGDGPGFIEAITYRMKFHTTADDPSKYRPEELVKPWHARDPIRRLRTYLIDKKYLDEDEDETWRKEVKAEVKAAVERFRGKIPSDVENMFEHKLARLDPYTEQQKEEFMEHWERIDGKIGGH
jgi:pyruvate dehydrogenase E1 component alpha subunit